MDVRITVAGEEGDQGALRSLREWLVREPKLRGGVRLVQHPPAPDRLGSIPDALLVTLGPGGVATAVASVLIAWIRRRGGDVSVKVTQPDGTSVEVSATDVRGLDAAGVRAWVSEVSRALAGGGGSREAGGSAVGG